MNQEQEEEPELGVGGGKRNLVRGRNADGRSKDGVCWAPPLRAASPNVHVATPPKAGNAPTQLP